VIEDRVAEREGEGREREGSGKEGREGRGVRDRGRKKGDRGGKDNSGMEIGGNCAMGFGGKHAPDHNSTAPPK